MGVGLGIEGKAGRRCSQDRGILLQNYFQYRISRSELFIISTSYYLNNRFFFIYESLIRVQQNNSQDLFNV